MASSTERWEEFTRRLSEASDAEKAPAEITRKTSLSLELDLGSLQMVTLVMDLEDDFQITVSDEELEQAGDEAGQIFDLLEAKLSTNHQADSS